MSRFKRFAHSLASGYVLLGANMVYTLASIPLALHYVGKAEFGLWALVTTIGGYITLVDFGLGASVARILIDHKDAPRGGHYGGMIQTGLLVGLVQGAVILVAGGVLAHFAGQLLDLDVGMRPVLKWLMTGQCAVLALSSATRTFSHILSAHQRFDITNYGQAILLGFGLVIMWIGFACGFGVYSILLAQSTTAVLMSLVNLMGCLRLRFLPKRGEWGRPTWEGFKDVFAFGNDIFIFAVGSQLINTSQTILLARLIGLEAVTVWSIFTRVFVVLQQVIYRLFDYSSSALAEMIVRGEREILAKRFQQVVAISASLSVAAGAIFAVCNKPFVDLWTAGRFESPLLQASDVKMPELLAQRLVARKDVAAQFLWKHLAENTTNAIGHPPFHNDQKEQVQEYLAADLNRLIQSGTPLDPRLLGSPTTNESPNPHDLSACAVFNRHVLEDVLEREIASSRKAHWSRWNDLLLALWLVITISLHAHTGLVGQAKAFGFMRYIFILEGIAFVVLTVLIHHWGGITEMLCASLACSLLFSFAYGLYRTRQYFNLTGAGLVGWHKPSLKLAGLVVPAALMAWLLTHRLPPLWGLLVNAATVGPWVALMMIRYGFETTLRNDVLRRMPKWARTPLARLAGLRTE